MQLMLVILKKKYRSIHAEKFHLPERLAAGNYRVVTDEELIEELSFPVYRVPRFRLEED